MEDINFSNLDAGQLITAIEIAGLAGVSKAAVTNWRSRGTSGFPSPAIDGPNGPLYRKSEIVSWLDSRGKLTASTKELQSSDMQANLWATADKLRGSMDASQYRHTVLTLLFLRRILDTSSDFGSNITLPKNTTWQSLSNNADGLSLKSIKKILDEIEDLNPKLAGIFPSDIAQNKLDDRRLFGLVDIISKIKVSSDSLEDQLGRAYEFFLGRFAALEGRSGGEFYTPEAVVRVLTEVVQPISGSVYDPCCGSGGMFVQSAKLRQKTGAKLTKVVGQELNPNTWKLGKMNLILHSIDADLGPHPADTFHEDLHKELTFDSIMANPPFNISDWGAEELQDDSRWLFGVPPSSNANMAWVQHIWTKLKPGGRAGIVLSNGCLTSDQLQELSIRKSLIENGAVEGIVALPPQLFYSTPIPVTIWFLHKPKDSETKQSRVLFVDAREYGHKITRTHRDLSIEDTAKIRDEFFAFRNNTFEGTRGFSAVADIEEIEKARWALTPSRYVGAAEIDHEANVPVEQLVERYLSEVKAIHALDTQIEKLLKE